MGTSCGLVPSACGTPENHIGRPSLIVLLKILVASCWVGVMGMSDAGSARFGKYEMRGVPGGGRMSENSGASSDRGVCFVDKAIIKLVLSLRISTRDCGVMSAAKSE